MQITDSRGRIIVNIARLSRITANSTTFKIQETTPDVTVVTERLSSKLVQ